MRDARQIQGTETMRQEEDSPEHHKRRSEYIRKAVQGSSPHIGASSSSGPLPPRRIVQFWNDPQRLPADVEECISSWASWGTRGFAHSLFDAQRASLFISRELGARYERAFERCYHPAMQSDYFRLCYLLAQGGFYVDADDACVGSDIAWLFEDTRLKIQPLCYDTRLEAMVDPATFLPENVYDTNWIFYFNNNPLIASAGHPAIEAALHRATVLLEIAEHGTFPDIQATTGPGNLSCTIFDLGMSGRIHAASDICVLREWSNLAVSKWPLSYRDDARNWRLSNRRPFTFGTGS